MKRYLHAFAMCQSMFCALPCPWKVWDGEARPYMLLFLPLVGLEIGIGWAVLAWLTQLLGIPKLVEALILCAYPYVATGFIHLDGFLDVTDAVKSWRDLERRREILKDSHVGAFAVIGCVLLLLAGFALFASGTGNWISLILIPVVSRCCSALAVTLLPAMGTSQYSGQGKNIGHAIVLSLMLVVALTAGMLLCGRDGVSLFGGVVGYGIALWRSYRSLQGMNGDISGYAITIGELCAVAVYVLI